MDIFAAKMWVAFAMQKLLTFFQQNICVFAVFQDRNFNVTLANFVKFWTAGPWFLHKKTYIVGNHQKGLAEVV